MFHYHRQFLPASVLLHRRAAQPGTPVILSWSPPLFFGPGCLLLEMEVHVGNSSYYYLSLLSCRSSVVDGIVELASLRSLFTIEDHPRQAVQELTRAHQGRSWLRIHPCTDPRLGPFHPLRRSTRSAALTFHYPIHAPFLTRACRSFPASSPGPGKICICRWLCDPAAITCLGCCYMRCG